MWFNNQTLAHSDAIARAYKEYPENPVALAQG
jgi:hypothetical protein